MNFFIRTDASIKIGIGHVIRCLTLADELRKNGAIVGFICRKEPGDLIEYIESRGYKVFVLPVGIDMNEDRKLTEGILKEQPKFPCWLIIDHYNIDSSWESSVRKFVKKILVIDDLANRIHDCDLLLDQNYVSNNRNRYKGLLPKECIQLMGPKYALLRPEFRKARNNFRKHGVKANRILVSMGGIDPTNETCKALRAIRMLNRPDISVDVVVGNSSPNKDKIKRLCSTISNVNFYTQVDNMAQLMTDADVSIGAGGSTTWERCCVGLPSIVIILAENQRNIAETLEKRKIVINLGWFEDVKESDIKNQLENLLDNPEQIEMMSSRCREIVDGRGTERIINKLFAKGVCS